MTGQLLLSVVGTSWESRHTECSEPVNRVRVLRKPSRRDTSSSDILGKELVAGDIVRFVLGSGSVLTIDVAKARGCSRRRTGHVNVLLFGNVSVVALLAICTEFPAKAVE